MNICIYSISPYHKNNMGSMNKASAKQVSCAMSVGNRIVKFQIDTGSTTNIIPVNFAKNVRTTNTTLKTWNNENYKPIGESRQIIKNPRNNERYAVNFIVCHNHFKPILGLRASEQIKLIMLESQNFERVNAVEDSCIFNDELGTLNAEHKLLLKDNVQPSIMGCRRTPVSLRPLLKKELKRLVNKGVIAPVEEPTEWISQAVITPKKDRLVRLCIDPRIEQSFETRTFYLAHFG